MACNDNDLDALVSLIATSVDEIKVEYQTMGARCPSLDASSACNEDTLTDKPKMKRAIKVIEAACAQLCASIARPEHTLINRTLAHEISACLQVVASQDIAGILLRNPDGVSVTTLSEISGTDADILSRVMRLLATVHIFKEVSPRVFANNKVSLKLATSEYTKDAVELNSREALKASAFLGDFLRPLSNSSSESPFHLAYGAPLMDYHNTPEGKGSVPKFIAGVTGWGEITGKSELNYAFPWTKYLSRTTQTKICDIGAGNGHILLSLSKAHKAYPFHAIIQDRPAFIELSKQLWNSEHPEAVQEGRVEFVPIDFFQQSPVEGCDIYYIRHCIHNWLDEKCLVILGYIASAMRSKPGCILLIHEIVLHPAIGQASGDLGMAIAGDETPPVPLLKNFGAARFREHAQDINMLNLLNAKERTLDEFIALGVQAGLIFERVWDVGETGLVQFRLTN